MMATFPTRSRHLGEISEDGFVVTCHGCDDLHHSDEGQITFRQAIARAKKHVAQTGHQVYASRTIQTMSVIEVKP